MRKSMLLVAALALLPVCTQAACLNASTTVTIPLSGTATVVEYDQNCNVLPATSFTVQDGGNGGAQASVSSSPSMTADSSGTHFAANGATPGKSSIFTFTYTPNGKTFVMTYVVGAAVTSISGGTTTP